jgi:hypothetical protein
MSLFTSSKIYPKIVREFYLHLEIVDILQQCLVLKTTVWGLEIRIDPDLITQVTDIPLVHPLGIPFLDPDNAPSWEEMLAFFDPTGTQVWGPNQTFLPIGWLQSPQRLMARIMLQNIWLSLFTLASLSREPDYCLPSSIVFPSVYASISFRQWWNPCWIIKLCYLVEAWWPEAAKGMC